MVKGGADFLDGINHKKGKAWKQLYADYYSPLCCYALKILKEREVAADVVQGVMVKLWELEVHFDSLALFHGYLYKTVYHDCLKMVRDKNVEATYVNYQSLFPDFDGADSFAASLEEEIVRKLRAVIDLMPEKRREVILLCLEDKSVEEVSEVLNISINTVKKHKKEAYQFIREMVPADILVLFYLFLEN